MYYLIQSNIYSDPEHHKIFEVLEELALPYESIELAKDTESIDLQVERKDVFVYGSVKLARLASQYNAWFPGSFYGGNHRFEEYAPYYGEDLLNYRARIIKLADKIDWQPNETKFIKPYQYAKVFTGKVFTEKEWLDFVASTLHQPATPLLHAETLIQISSPKTILKEARMWVIGGQVIEGVYYKYLTDNGLKRDVDAEAFEFVRKMVQKFEVAEAFVIDVGLTNEGWKVIEVNCINSAGFYQANVKTIVKALEMYFGD